MSSRISALDYGPDGQKLAMGADNGAFQVLEVNTGNFFKIKHYFATKSTSFRNACVQ